MVVKVVVKDWRSPLPQALVSWAAGYSAGRS
jgi:hypothetical protein